jgi:hypothetical protein
LTTTGTKDILAQLDQKGDMTGVPISCLIDARHELTAIIKENLHETGSKEELRAALIARNGLDEFFFHTTDEILVKGNVTELVGLKRAIILSTYSELLYILEDSWRRLGRTGQAAKLGMSAVTSDPDLIGRFNLEDQAKIRAIAAGLSLLAKRRLNASAPFNQNKSRDIHVVLAGPSTSRNPVLRVLRRGITTGDDGSSPHPRRRSMPTPPARRRGGKSSELDAECATEWTRQAARRRDTRSAEVRGL